MTAPAAAVQTSAQRLEEIPLDRIQPSRTNPRQHFDESYIAELGGSIRTSGVLVPLLVRPIDRKDGHYEIVAGECRYRAAQRVGIRAVPCVVRRLTDRETLEHQVIENLQRRDLHPLEEAAGYQQLMTAGKYDVDAVARRVHKSAKFVYDRVKLLQLTPELQRLFRAGRITPAHAVILARLSPKEQARAADPERGGLWAPEHVDDYLLTPEELRLASAGLKLRTSRELQGWVDEHVRFNHKTAPDPMLFPDTAAAIAAVKDKDRIVPITFEYQVHPEARDASRIYGPRSWKYADGAEHKGPTRRLVKAKTCSKSQLGVVVAGERRGASFRICVSKSCEVHWPQPKRATKKKAASSAPAAPRRDIRDKWEEEARRQRERREREVGAWKRIQPQLRKQAAEALKQASATTLTEILARELQLASAKGEALLVPRGRTADQMLRHLVFRMLLAAAGAAERDWYELDAARKMAEAIGLKPELLLAAAAKEAGPRSPTAAKPRRRRKGAAR